MRAVVGALTYWLNIHARVDFACVLPRKRTQYEEKQCGITPQRDMATPAHVSSSTEKQHLREVVSAHHASEIDALRRHLDYR